MIHCGLTAPKTYYCIAVVLGQKVIVSLILWLAFLVYLLFCYMSSSNYNMSKVCTAGKFGKFACQKISLFHLSLFFSLNIKALIAVFHHQHWMLEDSNQCLYLIYTFSLCSHSRNLLFRCRCFYIAPTYINIFLIFIFIFLS